ncbi:hypothetical protein ACWGI1_13115 [Streptomyces sp. NPDC054835]|uniref:hypothetical protein n=1 Tax=Streptomyces sp. NBC_01268 TaxID=2903806 RepID=UPI002E34E2A9|nr:hypothetical protein [Streptomyces sp. NBC_01268]
MDLQAWLKWIVETRGYKESTAINRYETLSGVFGFAVANECIAKNPCQHGPYEQEEGEAQGEEADPASDA